MEKTMGAVMLKQIVEAELDMIHIRTPDGIYDRMRSCYMKINSLT